MAILSQEMIDAMRKHHYVSEGHYLTEFTIPFFKSVAEKLPTRLSPNAVTLFGLVSVIMTSTNIVYHTCTGNVEAVQIGAYFCIFGFFMWLVCDNMDGILARARGISSSFGEVLDHGGDAIAMLLSSATISSFLYAHTTPLVTFAWILSDVSTNYIVEPYTIYICGKFYLESFDFNEIMLLFMLISWLTATFGVDVWLFQIIPGSGFQLRYVFYIMKVYVILSLSYGKVESFFATIEAEKMPLKYVLQPLLPLLTVLVSSSIAYVGSSQEFLEQNIIQLSLCFAFSIVRLHLQFLIFDITKTRAALFIYSLIFPILLALGIVISGTPLIESKLTHLFLIIIAMDAVIYSFRLLYEIYQAIETRLFVLEKSQNFAKTHNHEKN